METSWGAKNGVGCQEKLNIATTRENESSPLCAMVRAGVQAISKLGGGEPRGSFGLCAFIVM